PAVARRQTAAAQNARRRPASAAPTRRAASAPAGGGSRYAGTATCRSNQASSARAAKAIRAAAGAATASPVILRSIVRCLQRKTYQFFRDPSPKAFLNPGAPERPGGRPFAQNPLHEGLAVVNGCPAASAPPLGLVRRGPPRAQAPDLRADRGKRGARHLPGGGADAGSRPEDPLPASRRRRAAPRRPLPEAGPR